MQENKKDEKYIHIFLCVTIDVSGCVDCVCVCVCWNKKTFIFTEFPSVSLKKFLSNLSEKQKEFNTRKS